MPQALPQFYAITAALEPDDQQSPILKQASGRMWLERFSGLLASDISLVQLRAKQLTERQLEELLKASLELNAGWNKRLVLNGAASWARRYGLSGIHLTAQALLEAEERPLSAEYLVGASCHDPEELLHAEKIGCDFACLSPVNRTKYYSDGNVLGLERFSQWVSQCSIPVYGLGGLSRKDLDEVRDAGGQGVAGISAFW